MPHYKRHVYRVEVTQCLRYIQLHTHSHNISLQVQPLFWMFSPQFYFCVFWLVHFRIWKNTERFWPNCKGYLLPLLIECNQKKKGAWAWTCCADMYSAIILDQFCHLYAKSAIPRPQTPGVLKALWIHIPPPSGLLWLSCNLSAQRTVSTHRTDERTRGWADAQIPLWFNSSTRGYSALPWQAKISH